MLVLLNHANEAYCYLHTGSISSVEIITALDHYEADIEKVMNAVRKSEQVLKTLRERYLAIVNITDAFSEKHLNDEYAQLIRYAVAALCRKRPSPVETGNAAVWACGVTHALGMVNFLFDKNQAPHIRASELYKAFGVSQSTGQGKSKAGA